MTKGWYEEMELKKEKWVETDKAEFLEYLRSFAKPEKEAWARRIINTKLPLLAIPTPRIKAIVKDIAKGDAISFLSLNIDDYYDSIGINGMLIMKIKDFAIMESYLMPYAERAENWATCDLLSFAVNSENKQKWWDLSGRLIKNDKPFARRIGIDILFKFILDEKYIDGIFEILRGFANETEYYVNMVNAWIIAECFTKQREKTLLFLQDNKLNVFTVNKAVSKCRDSFRITPEDKEMLLQFKR